MPKIELSRVSADSNWVFRRVYFQMRLTPLIDPQYRLKKRGIEVEELYFPDEGHGFAKESNRLLYYEQLAKFFDKYLKK